MTEKRDYLFGLNLILLLILIVEIIVFASLQTGTFSAHAYYANGDAPNGWYHQKDGISASQVSRAELYLPICDHSYLGPLHGVWKLGSNVVITQSGWYDLRVENGYIVEVFLREKSNGSW